MEKAEEAAKARAEALQAAKSGLEVELMNARDDEASAREAEAAAKKAGELAAAELVAAEAASRPETPPLPPPAPSPPPHPHDRDPEDDGDTGKASGELQSSTAPSVPAAAEALFRAWAVEARELVEEVVQRKESEAIGEVRTGTSIPLSSGSRCRLILSVY